MLYQLIHLSILTQVFAWVATWAKPKIIRLEFSDMNVYLNIAILYHSQFLN